MIRIRVIPAHSCSAITETEQFKWTQIWGAVVIVTTSNTCKTHIMRTMPALSVTCIHPRSFSHSRRTLLPLTCRWEKHHEPVLAIPSNPKQHRYVAPLQPPQRDQTTSEQLIARGRLQGAGTDTDVTFLGMQKFYGTGSPSPQWQCCWVQYSG